MCLVHNLLPLLASQCTSAWGSESQSLGAVVILSRQWVVTSRELVHPICRDSLTAGRDGTGFISLPANFRLRILLLLFPYSKNCNLADLYTPNSDSASTFQQFSLHPSVLISVDSMHSVAQWKSWKPGPLLCHPTNLIYQQLLKLLPPESIPPSPAPSVSLSFCVWLCVFVFVSLYIYLCPFEHLSLSLWAFVSVSLSPALVH